MAWPAGLFTAPIESRFPSCHSLETIVGVAAAALVLKVVPQLPPVPASKQQVATARNVLRRMEPPIARIDPSVPRKGRTTPPRRCRSTSGADDRAIVLDDPHLITDGDRSVAQDVRGDAGAVEKILDQARARHRFQM